ncbi:MAG TPA: sigma-70 family RNA polymerase sigma factor [Candidatus Saccharimonadia bacterium]|jgi:RNA polymerase sigma-70 factor (ECF subfamily)|nr:sigma-70 family RNA polymerase sigma factor [Candidatus Saccharimonadia bacterium]
MPDDDQTLIERAKTDPQAFGMLYDRYYTLIAGYIQRRLADPVAAQDVTAIVFFKAMTHLRRFHWRGVPFSAWLYRIASNEINTYFRRTKSHPVSLDELADKLHFELPAGTDLERDLIVRQEEAQRYQDFRLVRELLFDLPPKYQEILALRYFEKKTLADIAIITGKKLGTVKSLVSRGLERLRHAYLAEHHEAQPSAAPTVIKVEE